MPTFEVMVANPAIRNLIREAKMHQARGTMETSRRDGMCTMDMALREIYEAGLVEYEDVLRYLDNPRSIIGHQPGAAPGTGPNRRGGGR